MCKHMYSNELLFVIMCNYYTKAGLYGIIYVIKIKFTRIEVAEIN